MFAALLTDLFTERRSELPPIGEGKITDVRCW
jgi:hypothetical protein